MEARLRWPCCGRACNVQGHLQPRIYSLASVDHSRKYHNIPIMLFVCHPKILRKHCLQFLLGVKMTPREAEDNADAKFWGDKKKEHYGMLWYFLEWSIQRSGHCAHIWKVTNWTDCWLREIAAKLNISIQQHDFCIRSSFFYYKKCFHFHAICQ